MKYVAIVLPEQNEGKQFGTACLVEVNDFNDLDQVKEIVLGKGLGVQGYDDGIRFSLLDKGDEEESLYSDVLILSLADLKEAVSKGQFDWVEMVLWRRWFYGRVDRKSKTVILDRKDVVISPIFEKKGYKIIYSALCDS